MTLGIRYAARSDVGMLREGNEDSAYAGARLIAVADGMGGHVGGEIASAAAINTLRRLDTEVPAADLINALEHAVQEANTKLHSIVEGDPSLQGMGTTLTAMLWSGSHIALVHIGDSRAYLLRNGELFQITRDHTLVQQLVDEGRISLDEAASHPQRSLLLRALDGRGEVEPDLALREAKAGDRYLLCSDGLSGVVTAETIHHVLTTQPEPEAAIRQLIDLANKGGGPDNITCVVADVVDLDRQQAPAGRPTLAGAAAVAGEAPGGPPTRRGDSPAQRAAEFRDTLPQPAVGMDGMPPAAPPPMAPPMPQGPPPGMQQAQQAQQPQQPPRARPRRRWTWLVVAVVIVLGLLGAGAYVGYQQLTSGFYIAQSKDGKGVVLYEGNPQNNVPGVSAGVVDDPKARQIVFDDLPIGTQQDVQGVINAGPTRQAADRKLDDMFARRCLWVVQAASPKDDQLEGVRNASQATGCKEGIVKTPVVHVKDLKVKTQALYANNATQKVANQAEATERLTALAQEAQDCKATPKPKDCP